MKRWSAALVAAAICGFCFAAGGEVIWLGADGSVAGRLLRGEGEEQAATFRFGLPRVHPLKTWSEAGAQMTLWETNGVRYTQTVLLTSAKLNPATPNEPDRRTPVLLVNIEGENKNAEYTEAFAELRIEISGKLQPLELQSGSILRIMGGSTNFAGALEIPESGIKLAQGEVLRFSGNIPPSLKGSMTVKIPLEPLARGEAIDRLKEIEFEAAFREAKQPNRKAQPGSYTVRREGSE